MLWGLIVSGNHLLNQFIVALLPVVPIFGEHFVEQSHDDGRTIWHDLQDVWRWIIDMLVHYGKRITAFVRCLTCQHLVKCATEAVDVGSKINVGARTSLLGTGVMRSAQSHPAGC